jgi:gliding motility-associated-like protein
MKKFSILVLFAFFRFINVEASHVMGGEITWICQGGNYIFELVFYRDCNGADINTVSETIKVWNHSSINQFTVNFVSRTDISPTCTPVAGSPPQLSCGNGTSGGNGIGAIEKVIYRSASITLDGTPPAQGWIFTFENFARSSVITNLIDPSNFGITIVAYIFQNPTTGTGCVDNSPRFLQDPFLVSCAGDPFVYNMNAVDSDLDSLAISFGHPLNNFGTGTFSPPTNPIEIPYEAGFSANSPTPGQSFNPNNIPANINPLTGEFTFTSFTTGNYIVKMIVKSFRNGVLIAQVEREIQLVVANCLPTNNKPVINGPFGGLFETTIFAGENVNFVLSSIDNETLVDGSPQQNSLTASGPMFGTNFTATTGCDILPCATLNQTPPILNPLGVSTTFNWQTSCDHLVNEFGVTAAEVPFNFVFRVQDNYCQVPKVSFVTITINVKNPGLISPAQITCIETSENGDLQISWNQVDNSSGSFLGYELHSLQNGLIATFPAVTTTSTTIAAINDNHDFYLVTISGCNGNAQLSSDTVSNIQMDLFNPANGTAVITWNSPLSSPQNETGDYYYIYREYPTGTWTLIDSVAFGGSTQFRDTIDICESFLNYQVALPNGNCSFTSNISGDTFEDMITPDIPVIQSVSIDTLTGQVTITWNVNGQADTYGYVIYQADQDGILFEVDTVWGINNVTYTFSPETNLGSLIFSVAAFDSCFTSQVPPTYQTSAKSTIHRTCFLSSTYEVCNQSLRLSWTAYSGWTALEQYRIYGRKIGESWELKGSTNNLFFVLSLENLQTYEFAIQALEAGSNQSFSNKITVAAVAPSAPEYHYTSVATVQGKSIKITHYIENIGGVYELLVERKNRDEIFVPIGKVLVNNEFVEFIDNEVDVDRYTYTYRLRIVDSCGNEGVAANEVTTILLNVQSDEINRKNYLTWSPYIGFDGSIIQYQIYRNLNGVWGPNPIALVQSLTTFYEDDLDTEELISGKVCYFISALESANKYGFFEASMSNEVCPVFEPLIFIPNTFTPVEDSPNPIFKPIVSLIEPSDYQLSIMNRWGEIIFQTNDINEGWDGTIKNTSRIAETGTYMYVLLVKDGNMQEVSRRGFVNLLK